MPSEEEIDDESVSEEISQVIQKRVGDPEEKSVDSTRSIDEEEVKEKLGELGYM